MLRSLLYFLKLAAFWMIFFTLYRAVFFLVYVDKIPDGKTSEALMAFFYSLRLDFSTIAYLLTIPLLLWGIQQFVKKNFLNRINHYFNLALISFITLLCISNIGIYGDWNALINYNTLFYLLKPTAMFPYFSTLQLIGAFIGIAAVIALFVLLFRVMILMVIPYSTGRMIYKIIIVPLSLPFAFLIMRGGTQSFPINERSSCFSETQFIDHVSINPVWHLGHMTLVAMKEENKNAE